MARNSLRKILGKAAYTASGAVLGAGASMAGAIGAGDPQNDRNPSPAYKYGKKNKTFGRAFNATSEAGSVVAKGYKQLGKILGVAPAKSRSQRDYPGKILGVAPAKSRSQRDYPGKTNYGVKEDNMIDTPQGYKTRAQYDAIPLAKKSPKMQPRLNERSITGGLQETSRNYRQGGEATDLGEGKFPSVKAATGTQSSYKSYQAGNRLQGGVTGTGSNTMKPYRLKKRLEKKPYRLKKRLEKY